METVIPARQVTLSVLSQGGIVYNQALDRYIYTSWTEYTFEFYESPTPWGPWKLFLSKDFGAYPWTELRYGGYATVAPSKFISDDGTEVWISSSTFAGGVDHYNFSLRRLWLTPYRESAPSNRKSNVNLAASADPRDVCAVSAASVRHGTLAALHDGDDDTSIDSYSVERKTVDYWGYTWPESYHVNQLVYTTGAMDETHGGWFADLRVQVRRELEWIDVSNVTVDPPYRYDEPPASDTRYVVTFDNTWGDGVRIIGRPGGSLAYTSIRELEVYYR